MSSVNEDLGSIETTGVEETWNNRIRRRIKGTGERVAFGDAIRAQQERNMR